VGIVEFIYVPDEPSSKQSVTSNKIIPSTMARLVAAYTLLFLQKTSLAFTPITFMHSTTTMSRQQHKTSAALSPLDEELQQWASTSNYGTIDKIIPSGSSGWASFRKVTVTDPPLNDDNKPVSFFVKSSTRVCEEMFKGEALGLQAMYACSQGSEDALRIPKVFHYGDYSASDSKGSFLIMEYLNLAGRSDDRALGRAMARMHLAPPTEEAGNPTKAFGFPVDNTIGGTPQPNPWTEANSGTNEWIAFFRDYRVGHQLNLAGDSYCSNLWEQDIAPRLHLLFEDLRGENEIKPSLLHGDLWSGNIGSADGKPSVFDPAVYWGHHEAEWG
jgi:protein-ribulosamine 3-kinase